MPDNIRNKDLALRDKGLKGDLDSINFTNNISDDLRSALATHGNATYQPEAYSFTDPKGYYGDLVDYSVTPDEAMRFGGLDELAARNQSAGRLIGRALGQFATEATLGTLEGIGYLAEVDQLFDKQKREEEGFSNWWVDYFGKLKEEIKDDTFAIHQTAAGQHFAPGDATWWASNFASIGTALSLMIPSIGVGRGLAYLGKAAKLTSTLAKTAKIADKAADIAKVEKQIANFLGASSSAIFSRYTENFMEAHQKFDESYGYYIDKGKNDSEARELAAREAASVWKSNAVMMPLDFMQYSGISKLFNVTGKLASATESSLGKKSIAALNFFGQMGSEALEEGYQFVAGKEAEVKVRQGIKPFFGGNFGERIGDYLDDPEMQTSMFWGAVGGGMFGAVGPAITKAYDKILKTKTYYDAKKLEASFLNDVSSYLKRTDDEFLTLLSNKYNEAVGKKKSIQEVMTQTARELVDFADLNNPELDDASKKELKDRVNKHVAMINEFSSKFTELDKSPLFRGNDNLKAKYIMSNFQLRILDDAIKGKSDNVTKLLNDNNIDPSIRAIKAMENRLRVINNLIKKTKDESLKAALQKELDITEGVFNDTIKAHKESNPDFSTETQIDKELETAYDSLIEDQIQKEYVVKPYIIALNNLSKEQIAAETKAREEELRKANVKQAENAVTTVEDDITQAEFEKAAETADVKEEGGSVLQQSIKNDVDRAKKENAEVVTITPKDEVSEGSVLQQEVNKSNKINTKNPVPDTLTKTPKAFMKLKEAIKGLIGTNANINDILITLSSARTIKQFNNIVNNLIDAYNNEQDVTTKKELANTIYNIQTIISNLTESKQLELTYESKDKTSPVVEESKQPEIEAKKAEIERLEKDKQEEIDNLFSRTQASTDKKLNTPVQKLTKEEVNKNIKTAKQQNKNLIEELENPEFLNDEKRNDEWDKKADELISKLPQGVSFRITNGKVEFFDNQSYREKGFGKTMVQVSIGNIHRKTEKFEVGDNLQVDDGSKATPAVVTKVNENGKVLEAKDEDGKIIISKGNIVTLAPINDRLKINAKYDAQIAQKQAELKALEQSTNKSTSIPLNEVIEQTDITPSNNDTTYDPLSQHLNDATNAMHSKMRDFELVYNQELSSWEVVLDENGNPKRRVQTDTTLNVDYDALNKGLIKPNDTVFYTINTTSDYTKGKFFHPYSVQIVINVRGADGISRVVGVLDAPYDSKLSGKYGYDMTNPVTRESVANNRALRDAVWNHLTKIGYIANNKFTINSVIELPEEFNSSVKEVLPGKLNTTKTAYTTSEFKASSSDIIFGYADDTFGNIKVPKGIDVAPNSTKTTIGERYLLFKHPNKNIRIPLRAKLKKIRQLSDNLKTTILTNAFREALKQETPADIKYTLERYFRLPQNSKKKMYVSKAKSSIEGIANAGDILISFAGDQYSLELPPINLTRLQASGFDLGMINPKTMSYIGSETYPVVDHTKLNTVTSNTPISIDEAITYNDYVMEVTEITIDPLNPIILTNIEVAPYNENKNEVAVTTRNNHKKSETSEVVQPAVSDNTKSVTVEEVKGDQSAPIITSEEQNASLDEILEADIEVDPNYNGNTIDSSDTSSLPKTDTKDDSEIWDETKELEWFKARFPNIPISVLSDLKEIASKGGSNAVAVFRNAAVYIYKNANMGVAYHEAFHIVFDLMLNTNIKLSLYRDARSKYKVTHQQIQDTVTRYRTDYNINITDAQAERIVLEEYMADAFADYVISEGNSSTIKNLPSKIVNIFKRLYNMIRNMFTNNITLNDVFYDIQKGKYNTSSLTKEQIEKFANNLPKNKLWSTRKTKRIVSNINHRLFTSVIPYIKNNSDGKYDNMENDDILISLVKEIGIENIYMYVFKDIRATLKANVNNMSKEQIQATIDVLNAIYNVNTGKYGALIPDLIKGLSYYGINIKRNKLNKISSDNNSSEEQNTSSENWQIDLNKKSTKDTVSFKMKMYLRGLINTNINSDNVKNDTGVFSSEFVGYDAAYNTLMGVLSDAVNVNDMLLKLKEMGSTHSFANQIYNDVVSNENLKNALWVTFSNPTRNRLYISQNTRANSTEFIIGEANRKNIKTIIINNWYNGILDKGKLVTEKTAVNNFEEVINTEYAKQLRVSVVNALKNNNFKLASDLLNESGLDVSEESLRLISNKKLMVRFIGLLNPILNIFEKGHNPFNKEGNNFKGNQLKKLADIVKNTTLEVREQSYVNVDGEKVYSNIKPNFVNTFVNKIKRLPKETLAYYLDDTNGDVMYIHGAIWMKDMYNEILDWEAKGRVGSLDNLDLFDYYELDGLTMLGQEAKSYNVFDHKSLKISNLALFSNNSNKTEAYYRILGGDASTSGIIKYKKLNRDEVTSNLMWVAYGEYKRILNIQKRLADKNISKIENYDTKENASLKTGFKFLQAFNNLNEQDVNFHFSNISNQDSKDWIKKQIVSYLNSKMEEYVADLERDSILYKDSKGTLTLIADNRSIASSKGITNFIADYYYNSFFANTQTALMFDGDLAYYKNNKNNKVSKSIDYQKRSKQKISPKSNPNVDAMWVDKNNVEHPVIRKRYKSVTVKDSIVVSNDTLLNNLRQGFEAIGMPQSEIEYRLSKFKENNLTDAQTYISIDFYKDTMIAHDRWNQEFENAYQNIKNEIATVDDIRVIMQPIKPFKFGHEKQVVDGSSNIVYPEQHKNSEIVLIPQFINSGNNEIKNFYNAITNGGIDSILFESAVKVGNKNIQNDYNNLDLTKFNEHNMSDRGIQQDTPAHHMDSYNLFGTQIRKLIMSNLDPNSDFIINLDNEVVPISLKGTQVVDFYQQLISENLKSAFSKIESKFSNITTLRDFLIEEAGKTTDTQDLEDALELVEINGELRFKLPLFFPSYGRKIESLIISIYKNNIVKQKIKGGAFIQASAFGFDDQLQIVSKDGAIQYMEAKIPYPSDDIAKKYVNADGSVSDNLIKDHPELFDGIGYRIPTEGIYSMIPLRVVGFTPREMGGIIMLPPEITTIAGSDFDVDKLYVMLPEYTIDSKGNYNVIPYYTKANENAYISYIYDNASRDSIDYVNFLSKNEKDRLIQLAKDNFDNFEKTFNANYKTNFKALKQALNSGDIKSYIQELNVARRALLDQLSDNMIEDFDILKNNLDNQQIKGISRVIEYIGLVNDKLANSANNEYSDILNNMLAVHNEELRMYGIKQEHIDSFNTNFNNAKNDNLNKLSAHQKNLFKTFKLNIAEQLADMNELESYSIFTSNFETNPVKYNTTISRNNAIISVMRSVLTHPSTTHGYRPGGYDALKHYVSNVIEKVYNVNQSYDDVMLPQVMDNFTIDNLVAKTLIGVAAVHNSLKPLLVRSNIAAVVPVKYGDRTIINFNNERTIDGTELISDNLAYFLAAVVDSTKDPVVNKINYNLFTANIISTALHLGLPLNVALNFFNSNVIRGIAKRALIDPKAIMNELYAFSNSDAFNYIPTLDFDVANNLSDLNQIDSSIILKAFLGLKNVADEISSVSVMIGADRTNTLGPTMADNLAVIGNFTENKDYNYIVNIDSILDNNEAFKGFVELGLVGSTNKLNEYMPFNSEILRGVRNVISKNLLKSNRQLSKKQINYINQQLIGFMYSGFPLFKSSIEDRVKLINEIPVKIDELSKKYPEEVGNNSFISYLSVEKIKFNNSVIKMLVGDNNSTISIEQVSDIKDSFLSLLYNEKQEIRELAINIIKYSYLTSGFTYSTHSIFNLIPTEAYINGLALDNKNNDISQYSYDIQDMLSVYDDNLISRFVDQFMRNNFTNEAYVPSLTLDNINKGDAQISDVDKGVPNVINGLNFKYVTASNEFPMYITYNIKDTKYLYKKVPNTKNVYVKAKGLGFGQHVNMYDMNNDLDSSIKLMDDTANYQLPKYEIDYTLKNSDGTKRLATVSNNVIKINPVSSIDEFFNYFEGKEDSVSSKQKKLVLDALHKSGYDLATIKKLLNTKKLINTFLILHEQDHIDNNDRDTYWINGKNLMTPDKIEIETRATKNALDIISQHFNTTINDNKPKQKVVLDVIELESKSDTGSLLQSMVNDINNVKEENYQETKREIDFQEEQTSGYRNRTVKNASADATIALAINFNSAGETLTKSSVLAQGKKYIAVNMNNSDLVDVDKIVSELNLVNAKTLNIAGNGIYTMKGEWTQKQVDDYTYELLKDIINHPDLKNKIVSIRTGGQTGFDEAGAKAGIKLGIPTTILAPKGWTFRDITGKDISNEQQFKARFAIQQASTQKSTSVNMQPTIKESSILKKEGNDIIYANFRIINGDFNNVVNNSNNRPIKLGNKLIEKISQELKTFTENNCK